MQFVSPTPVQAQSIPAALEGKDVLGTAQTGTGKTGAFSVPMLARIYTSQVRRSLILCPTRELAAQIHDVLRKMGRGLRVTGSLVVGGESFFRQTSELKRDWDYVVATPGRLNDHLMEGTADLSGVDFLVLDEVDRMLDMGFAPQIKQILQFLPKERQTLLFSATLPPEIQSMAATFLKNPVRVEVGSVEAVASKVTETTIMTKHEEKNEVLLKELETREGKVLVFTRTQSRADRLARLLDQKGHGVVRMHGGCSQGQRKFALNNFRNGTCRILVATDLAGRGIDVNDIEHVINFDVPGSREDYIHRIGRTGRFGKEGNAVNFLEPGDRDGQRVVSGQRTQGGGRPQGKGRGKPRAFGGGGRKFDGYGFGKRFSGRRHGGENANNDMPRSEESGGRGGFRPARPEKEAVDLSSIQHLVETAESLNPQGEDAVATEAKQARAAKKEYKARSSEGFKPREGGFRREGFKPREGGFRREGFKPREGGFKGGFKARGPREGGFKRDGDFQPREGGFRREGGFQPREGGFRREGFQPREGGFKREGGFQPREGGFKPRRSFGAKGGEGFRPRWNKGEGFAPRGEGAEGGEGFKPRRSFGGPRDGFKPRRAFGGGEGGFGGGRPGGFRGPRREGGEGFGGGRKAFGGGPRGPKGFKPRGQDLKPRKVFYPKGAPAEA